MGAFDENAIEMLKLFIDMTEGNIQKIAEAGERGDVHALAELAHSLKGAARSACLPALGDAAARLQSESEGKKLNPETIQEIRDEFTRAKTEIDKL